MSDAVRLSAEDRFKSWLPARLYYPYKIAKEANRAEPELAILREIVPADRTAVDVGANRGIYSYALSRVASRVEAFEPNPALARFVGRMLGRRARVHAVALSDRAGTATLHVPSTDAGVSLHLLGSLTNVHVTRDIAEVEVALATLDGFDFADVGFIKIDVEGSEREVIEGAARTIARDRPNLLVELLNHPHRDPRAEVAEIAGRFDYVPWIVAGGMKVDAWRLLHSPERAYDTNNVLFTPR
jgi:FkbM family methyltransferase